MFFLSQFCDVGQEKRSYIIGHIVSYLQLRSDVESGIPKKEMNIFRNLAIRKTHEKTQIFEHFWKESQNQSAWRHKVARLTIWKELPQTNRDCHTQAEKIRAAAAATTSVSGKTAAYRVGQALKILLREPCGVSTGAVAVSAGWAFSVPIRCPLSHPQ